MPNITEFDAGALQIRPTEIGVESTAAAGRRLGVYGSQIAGAYERAGTEIGRGVASAGQVAEQYMAHREINTGAMQAATFVANKNKQLNDFLNGADIDQNDPDRQDKITARVNNPQAINQWREQNLEPAFEQFSQGFATEQGRQWFERWQDSYRNHVLEHGTAVQSSMAGVVVQANTEKTINALSAASFNDPSSLEFNKNMLKHSLEGTISSSPTLSPEHAAKVREELTLKGEEALVKSAVQGAIIKGGNWQSIANDPKNEGYVNQAENLQFEKLQRYYANATAAAEKQNILLTKQIAEMNAHTFLNDSWARNVKADANGNFTINPQLIKDAADVPLKFRDAPDARNLAEATIKFAQSEQKPKATVDNPDTLKSLNESLYQPGADFAAARVKILQAATNKEITPATRGDLLELNQALQEGPIKDPTFSAQMKNVEQILGTDIEGRKRFADFQAKFLLDYLNERKKGLAGDAMTLKNPDGSWDENSFLYKAMKPYMRDPTTIMMNTLMQRAGVPASIALPGQEGAPTNGERKQFTDESGKVVWGVFSNGQWRPE